VSNFDWITVSIVLLISCLGKIIGCGVGARLAGSPARESLAIGFAMERARGSMEIILGLTAFQNGLIGERLLVALVFMGARGRRSSPVRRSSARLGRHKPARFAPAMSGKRFVRALLAQDETAAVRECRAVTAAFVEARRRRASKPPCASAGIRTPSTAWWPSAAASTASNGRWPRSGMSRAGVRLGAGHSASARVPGADAQPQAGLRSRAPA
jgi:hypothetical protein